MSLIKKNESVHGLYLLKGYILDLLFGSSPTSIIQKPKEGAQKPARCVWEWGTSQRNTSKNDDEPMNVVFFHSKIVRHVTWITAPARLWRSSCGPPSSRRFPSRSWALDVSSWISNCLLMFIGDQTLPNNFNRSVKNSYCWWKLNMICHQEVAKKRLKFLNCNSAHRGQGTKWSTGWWTSCVRSLRSHLPNPSLRGGGEVWLSKMPIFPWKNGECTMKNTSTGEIHETWGVFPSENC